MSGPTTYTLRTVPAEWTPCPIKFNIEQLPRLTGPRNAKWLHSIQGPYYDSPVSNNGMSMQDLARTGDKFLKGFLDYMIRVKYPDMEAGRRDRLSRLFQSNLVLSHIGFQLRLDKLMPMSKEAPVQKCDADRFEAYIGLCVKYYRGAKDADMRKKLKDEFMLWLVRLFRDTVFPLFADCLDDERAYIPQAKAVRSRYDLFNEQREKRNEAK